MGVAIAKGILKTLGIAYNTTTTMSAVEEAKKDIQEKCGFAHKTMEYLSAYQFANDLFLKLWNAMK